MKQENDMREKLSKEAEKLQMEREVHVKMLEVMMLATKMDDDVEYATRACEFLDRVEEACVVFMEQEQTEGEH